MQWQIIDVAVRYHHHLNIMDIRESRRVLVEQTSVVQGLARDGEHYALSMCDLEKKQNKRLAINYLKHDMVKYNTYVMNFI